MNEWPDLLKQLGLQIAPWMIIVGLVLYIFRERLGKGLDTLLNWLSKIFRGEWSYRRFERTFRPAIRATHLYMRVVGIRSEKGRDPTIPEAYVPLRLAPYVDANARDTDRSSNKLATVGSTQAKPSPSEQHWFIEDVLQKHTTLVVL